MAPKRLYAEAFAESTDIASYSSSVASYQPLTADEVRLNEVLSRQIAELPNAAIERSFLLEKPTYEKSALFKMLQRMPKGAVLHTHGIASGNFTELARRIKASEGKVWTYIGEDKRGPPHFLPTNTFKAQTQSPGTEWVRADLMHADEIYKQLTLPAGLENVEANWSEFLACWDRVNGLARCCDFYYGENGFLWHILEDQWRTGVWYIEIKEALFSQYFRYDGTTLSDDEWLTAFRDTVDRFKASHPGFIGARAVPVFLKILSEEDARKAFQRSVVLKTKFPDYVAGFDIAGPEDAPNSVMFAKVLEEERARDADAAKLPLFPHAGETNIPSARQIVEAVSLGGVRRIGHGFALSRWPKLIPFVIQEGICLEVCPISNQVLGYFPNLAAHPAPGLLRSGVPLTISPDDAGMWHYSDVTYDWVAASKAWDLNLAEIRAMAKNSILHCTLSDAAKEVFLNDWEKAWNLWIADSLKEHSSRF